ncbi:uncharacterized mitochondrial protein AtMg00810-like [Aristolochia californica]|uniref:uncharacterized mitochondrial protein AtMg00810-like n=1 Tax=Aristolochia californica TaxID=171875 RepID=UPI0035DCE5D0
MVVYVDDIVITYSDLSGTQQVKQDLNKEFQTRDLGLLKYFLEIEVLQSGHGIILSQRKFVLDLLKEIGMLGCKPMETPMEPNVKLFSRTVSEVDVGYFQSYSAMRSTPNVLAQLLFLEVLEF